MNTLQLLSSIGGILSLAITMLCVVVGGFYLAKTGANTAQQSAINAMQSELQTLRGRIDDLNKENTRQEHIINTICVALEKRGLIITISGEMINIEDSKQSTTVRIQESEKTI